MPPDSKQLTIAYAAGASLAAVTLVYVFGPTFFIDGVSANASASDRKRTVVGLANPANDCFVNSVLQALAGLGELRSYLARRTVLQADLETRLGSKISLFKGKRTILTRALKVMLDSLNERPIYRKTISAVEFLGDLERVFRQRISRTQQDAQEFLQVIAQTLAEEHIALEKLKVLATELDGAEKQIISAQIIIEPPQATSPELESSSADSEPKKLTNSPAVITDAAIADATTAKMSDDKVSPIAITTAQSPSTEDPGMPLEGKLESSIECQTCGFKPKPTVSTFVVLTLTVPQVASTTLDDCLNETLSTEYIDDFQCAKCHLQATISYLQKKLASASESSTNREELESTLARLQKCLETDPESIPADIKIPSATKSLGRSRIARRTYMSSYPDILAIHLSRSIFDMASRKNSCKMSFPENLVMGPLLDRMRYKAIAVVTHKGGHESGHYECFRRQLLHQAPYSTPTNSALAASETSGAESPVESFLSKPNSSDGASQLAFNPAPSRPESLSSRLTNQDQQGITGSSTSAEAVDSFTSSPPSVGPKSSVTKLGSAVGEKSAALSRTFSGSKTKKARGSTRWWRISDDKIKEARTSDVLAQQKEVYLLFYERESSREPSQ